MTTLVANNRLDMETLLENGSLLELFEWGTVINHSSTVFQIKDIDDTQESLTLTGTFGGYTGDFYPTTGTITGGTYSPGSTGFSAFTFSGASMSVQDFTNFVNTDDLTGLFTQLLQGADMVSGAGLDDVLYGFGGHDTIVGAGGNDTLFGDGLQGQSGNDTLTGGAGADTLIGAAGSDTFLDTRAGLSGDTISDFTVADKIVLTDATLAGFTFSLTGNTLTYAGGSLTFGSAVNGVFVATAAAGGGVQLTLQPYDARNDFNGDGRSDVLWRSDSGQMTNWLGQINGGLADNTANAANGVPTSWQIAGTGDFNGDGKDDILWRNDDGQLTNWLGNANGGYSSNAANAYTAIPTSWHVAGTGDFNGDGRDDILWRNVDGTMTNWLGTAVGGYIDNSANASLTIGTSWHIVGTGDFNGDGRDDILWRNTDGSLTNWLGQANGSHANNASASTSVATSWHISGTGDFNGDGRDDILWRNDAGDLTNWLGQADGSFANNPNASVWVSNSWHIASTGDFNGDHRDDILWRNDSGDVASWTGQADGGFANNPNASVWVPTNWAVQAPDGLWV